MGGSEFISHHVPTYIGRRKPKLKSKKAEYTKYIKDLKTSMRGGANCLGGKRKVRKVRKVVKRKGNNPWITFYKSYKKSHPQLKASVAMKRAGVEWREMKKEGGAFNPFWLFKRKKPKWRKPTPHLFHKIPKNEEKIMGKYGLYNVYKVPIKKYKKLTNILKNFDYDEYSDLLSTDKTYKYIGISDDIYSDVKKKMGTDLKSSNSTVDQFFGGAFDPFGLFKKKKPKRRGRRRMRGRGKTLSAKEKKILDMISTFD
jgi:hypothetical protein